MNKDYLYRKKNIDESVGEFMNNDVQKIRPRPAFFDLFGLPLFALMIVMASWSLYYDRPLPKGFVIFLLIVSILGVLIDSRNVYVTYKNKVKDLVKK